MKFISSDIVHVYYRASSEKILVGRLALKNRKILFEYDVNFIKLGLNLSPFKLPLKSGVIANKDYIFDGLFGVFNDSLPDGWGRLLLDRALLKHHVNPNSLSVLDRLCFVGSNGMGALTYEPETQYSTYFLDNSLDEIAKEINEFQNSGNDKFVEDLLELNHSSAGARPKVLMDIENTYWLIKFPANSDLKDIGAIEYAYHLMAKDAGLEVTEAKLFPGRNKFGYFGCKRFDKADNRRVHMHSLSGLLHVDHRTPSLDYELIMKATIFLTRDIREAKKQFRNCVFNVLSHNRDDHSKNFSFLMRQDGSWSLSPSYDLTFSSGPRGEHCTMVMGEGKHPGIKELLELAKISNIKNSDALIIIEEVKSVINKWPHYANLVGVSDSNTELITSAIKKNIKESF